MEGHLLPQILVLYLEIQLCIHGHNKSKDAGYQYQHNGGDVNRPLTLAEAVW
jgi:hypothetical protein